MGLASMSKQALSSFFQRWVNRIRRPNLAAPASTRHRARLRVEEFEDRMVPATLPTVGISDIRTLTAGFQPQVAADPTNPNHLVLVSAASGGASINGQYSLDGGVSWSNFTVAGTGTSAGPT